MSGSPSPETVALQPFSSRKFPGLRKQRGTSESVKLGGDQIEYEDEDPRIRAMFEEELNKRGVRSQMGDVYKSGELTVGIITNSAVER